MKENFQSPWGTAYSPLSFTLFPDHHLTQGSGKALNRVVLQLSLGTKLYQTSDFPLGEPGPH